MNTGDAQTGEHLEPSRFIMEIPDALKISAKEAAAKLDPARAITATTAATSAATPSATGLGSSCARAAQSMTSVARASVAGETRIRVTGRN